MRSRVIMVAAASAIMAVSSTMTAGSGASPGAGRGELFRRPSHREPVTVPPGFHDDAVISGLSSPTVVQFAPDGRVFVGQKGGVVLEYETPGDPTGMNGTILPVDPATGAAWPGNPLSQNGDPTDDPIIAVGMRNPFRFDVRPGSDRIWLGDVGWNDREEIDPIRSAGDPLVEDFGWPCYEGAGHQSGYEGANLPICSHLYAHPNRVTRPYLAMSHGQSGCDGSNVYSAVGFHTGSTFPPEYDGAFFFGDVVRGCLWAMFARPNGDPSRSTLFTFGTGIFPTDVKTGSNGDLFYVDVYGGSIHEISYTG
jgi:glucose/arabinose dehydrogenase